MTENDLISREAVLKESARWKDYLDEDMIQRIQAGIKRLPAQGRKTGRWERHYSRGRMYADCNLYCSACGCVNPSGWATLYKFCPGCGAKMERSGEE